MKIGICGDAHVSKKSSIIMSRGEKYSTRLEHCIKSVNWAEKLFKDCGCEFIIYGGDFFDTDVLDAEVITAVNDIEWSDLPKFMLLGNHEMGSGVLDLISSANLFKMKTDCTVVDTPCKMPLEGFSEICFLPYILEDNRQPIEYYFGDRGIQKRIIISHNDIAGMQMGPFISKTGFSIEEIQKNCDLFINGHLHNGGKIADRMFNIGILTGQNFGEDATKYEHQVFILDTDTLEIMSYVNPYAFNFYKIDDWTPETAPLLKNNAVITVKCSMSNAESAREWIKNTPNIIESRLIIEATESENGLFSEGEEPQADLSGSHLEKFVECVHEKIGTTTIVDEELSEVCK